MKKFNILMAGAIALFATSCEKDLDPALPQENPQEPVLTTGDITTVAGGVLAEGQTVINLEAYRGAGEIPVLNLPETNNLPEGAVVEYKVELANNEGFNNPVVLDTYVGETEETQNNYYVLTDNWNAAHIQLFGKDPKAQTVYYRVPVYVNLDGTDFRYSSTTYYGLSGVKEETCMDNGVVIENAYYLMSSATGMTLADAQPFTQVYPGSPYDEPYFDAKVKVTEDVLQANGGQCKWMIAPQSSVDANSTNGVFGPVAGQETATEGQLTAESPAQGILSEAGKYLIHIDVWNNTFTVTKLEQPNVLYTPGDANGWDQLNSAWMTLDNGSYYCYAPFRGGFKLCENPNWDDNAANWGVDPEDPIKLMNGQEAGNIPVEEAGLYRLNVTYDSEADGLSTYEFISLDANKIGLIGGFAASGWNDDVFMAPELDDAGNLTGVWTAEATFAAGDEFKFRFDSAWTYNLGGDQKALTQDGANIKVAEAGTYTIKLFLLGGYAHFEMEKK